MTKRIMVVLGTRPEAIKLAPVITALRGRPEIFEPIVCSTGQHREILDQVLTALNIRPDLNLDVMQDRQELSGLTARLLVALQGALGHVAPDRVIVQGDTTTALAAALSAFYCRIPVAHVEAGLRSHSRDLPFPEEFNRKAISLIADIHFAPTRSAADALIAEGIQSSCVHVTGNTVVDALKSFEQRQAQSEPAQGLEGGRSVAGDSRPLVLVSCHRRETDGTRLKAICEAVSQIAREFPSHKIILLLHPNPAVRGPVSEYLGGDANVDLQEPVSHFEFLRLLSRASLVVTDSGGIQEEAPSFAVPVLILRDRTERPEAVEAGTAFLVGADKEAIVAHARELLRFNKRNAASANPFGDGHAAQRIVDVLADIA